MNWARLRRQTVALAAAYAVALQALFASLIAVAPATLTLPLAMLCVHDTSDGGGVPLSGDLPCAAICAAMVHGVSGPMPAGVVLARTEPLVLAAVAPVRAWVPPQIAIADTHAPRGPPLV